jgi:branched-chain amino acid transport system permease protein
MALQVLVNAIISGTIYAMIAVGFNLVYSTHRFFYIAHGAVSLVSAFAFYFTRQSFSIWIASGAAILASLILAILNELLIHRPLRERRANSFSLFLASSSSLTITQSLLLLAKGSETYTYQWPNNVLEIGSIRITHTQILEICITLAMFGSLWWIMRRTFFGKSLQAIAEVPTLARAIGLPIDTLYLQSTLLSALFAAVGGVLLSFEQDLRFNIGMESILKAITACTIGGIGNVPAALLGGLFLGLIENLTTWFFPSSYKTLISSSVMIGFLLFRPTGLLGTKFFPNR